MSKESEKKGIEASFKSMDTEEFLDIYFNRPIGYAWALFFKKLKVHPNVVTIYYSGCRCRCDVLLSRYETHCHRYFIVDVGESL